MNSPDQIRHMLPNMLSIGVKNDRTMTPAHSNIAGRRNIKDADRKTNQVV